MKLDAHVRRADRLRCARLLCALAFAGACGGEQFEGAAPTEGKGGASGSRGDQVGRAGTVGNHGGAGSSSNGGALSAISGGAGRPGAGAGALAGGSSATGGVPGASSGASQGGEEIGGEGGASMVEQGGDGNGGSDGAGASQGGASQAGTSSLGGTAGTLGGGSAGMPDAGTAGTPGGGGASPAGGSSAGMGGKGCETSEWFPDEDGDGYGRSSGKVVSCMRPNSGRWVLAGGDCNDDNDAVKPSGAEYSGDAYTAPEGSDSFDYDCSGREVSDPSQLGAAPACSGLGLLECENKAPGFVTTGRSGAGVNPLCGSDKLLRCVASGISCTSSVESVSERHRCR